MCDMSITNNSKNDLLNIFSCLKIQKELKIINGNDNVEKLINGRKLTKKIRNRKNNNVQDISIWNAVTQKRYESYISFIPDSEEDYPEICNNIKIINHMFNNFNNIRKLKIVELVHKTDSKLLKLFKEWDLVQ